MFVALLAMIVVVGVDAKLQVSNARRLRLVDEQQEQASNPYQQQHVQEAVVDMTTKEDHTRRSLQEGSMSMSMSMSMLTTLG